MGHHPAKEAIIGRLQKEVLALQGFKKPGETGVNSSLGRIEHAFPGKVFPTGTIHEFISYTAEHAAATSGFISGLAHTLMANSAAALWISNKRTVFPPSLSLFGIAPEQIVFIDLVRQKDVLWAVEEALKCPSVPVVVGELTELGFTESRRLQLAVEHSRATGFIHRYKPRSINPVACAARWKVETIASGSIQGLPGLGLPRWQVQLLRVRNGQPGSWHLEWDAGQFRYLDLPAAAAPVAGKRKTG